jgi:hypothetical protein
MVTGRQAPASHVPPRQSWPQAPQWSGSVLVSSEHAIPPLPPCPAPPAEEDDELAPAPPLDDDADEDVLSVGGSFSESPQAAREAAAMTSAPARRCGDDLVGRISTSSLEDAPGGWDGDERCRPQGAKNAGRYHGAVARGVRMLDGGRAWVTWPRHGRILDRRG